MSKKMFATAALSAAIFALAASPALAGTLDQSQTSGSDGAAGVGSSGVGMVGQTNHSGQTFTAGISGALDQADLYLKRNCGSSTEDLSVQIRTSSGNPALPTNTVLATATVPSASVPSSIGWVTVHFPTPATVSGGTRYALVAASVGTCIISLDPLIGTAAYGWGLDSHNPYGGGTRLSSSDAGASWSSQAGADLAFKTFVVPEAPAPPGPDPDPTGPGTGTGSGTGSDSGSGTTTTATGLRAAALKKCKKKRGAARRKCKQSANRLPL
jgi:hypothetical protein